MADNGELAKTGGHFTGVNIEVVGNDLVPAYIPSPSRIDPTAAGFLAFGTACATAVSLITAVATAVNITSNIPWILSLIVAAVLASTTWGWIYIWEEGKSRSEIAELRAKSERTLIANNLSAVGLTDSNFVAQVVKITVTELSAQEIPQLMHELNLAAHASSAQGLSYGYEVNGEPVHPGLLEIHLGELVANKSIADAPNIELESTEDEIPALPAAGASVVASEQADAAMGSNKPLPNPDTQTVSKDPAAIPPPTGGLVEPEPNQLGNS